MFIDQEKGPAGWVVEPSNEDLDRLGKYRLFVEGRRKSGDLAKMFTQDPENAKDIAALLAAGGIVGIMWGEETRRIYCLTCAHTNRDGQTIINRDIKKRDSNQPLGVGCLPESIRFIAELRQTPALVGSLGRLTGKDPNFLSEDELTKFLDRVYERNVGLIFYAKESFPDTGTKPKNNKATVLIVGQHNYNDSLDVYNPTLWELATTWGMVILGSSGNEEGKKVLSLLNQKEAVEFLSTKVDGLVIYQRLSLAARIRMLMNRFTGKLSLSSSTVFDLTEEVPILFRSGNTPPEKFKDVFPDLVT